jgi:hypothetical protein
LYPGTCGQPGQQSETKVKDFCFKEHYEESERGEREGAEWVVREGVGAGERNDPNLICTYE